MSLTSPSTEPRRQSTARGTTVIVGAAQGIGAAVARRLAVSGEADRLVLADIRADATETLAAELRSVAAIDVTTRGVDISSHQAILDLVEATPDARHLAIVAGIFRTSPSLETTWAEFETVLNVNLLGTFFVAQAFAGQMIANGGGSIVAVCSIAARMPRMRQAAYSASKAGMRQALRVLAMETVPLGVRVNFVSPGPTDTPMMRDLAADHDFDDLALGSTDALRPRIPSGRVASPDDVARCVAFLLSDAAAHVAFHDLYVDGGESLGL